MVVGHFSISDAFAYMDPNSITLAIQLLAAALIGAGISVKLYWEKIKMKFLKLLLVQVTLISFFSFLPELSNPYLNFAYKVVGVLSAQLYVIYKSEWVVSYNSICDSRFDNLGQ